MGKEQELRPCPWCQRSMVLLGQSVRKWEHPALDSADYECPGITLWFYDTPEHHAAWNRRSSSDEQTDEKNGIDYNAHAKSPSPAVAGGVTEAMRKALDMCERYAEFIRRVPSANLEEHPYLPELEDVIEALTAALAVRDEGMWEGSNGQD